MHFLVPEVKEGKGTINMRHGLLATEGLMYLQSNVYNQLENYFVMNVIVLDKKSEF